MGKSTHINGRTLTEELKRLERMIPESEKGLTMDDIILSFADKSVIARIMEIRGDLDLQFDLSSYGYPEYILSSRSYQDEGSTIAEKLRKLRRVAALIRLRDDIENNNAGLPLIGGIIRRTEDGSLILKVFDNKLPVAAVLVRKQVVLEDGSYEPQEIFMRYSGRFSGESGKFYEATEQLTRYGQLTSVSFHSYDEGSVLRKDIYDFSNPINAEPIDSHRIIIADIPYDKKDSIGGISFGLHPNRVETVASEEYPSGSARRKH